MILGVSHEEWVRFGYFFIGAIAGVVSLLWWIYTAPKQKNDDFTSYKSSGLWQEKQKYTTTTFVRAGQSIEIKLPEGFTIDVEKLK